MKSYLIGNYTIHDEVNYMEYIKRVGSIVACYNGKTLCADHHFQVLEGSPEKVLVVVEFDSKKDVLDFYHSEEYQKIIHFRKDSSNGWVAVTEGFVPPKKK